MKQISRAEARRIARNILLFAEHMRSPDCIFDTVLIAYGDAHLTLRSLRQSIMPKIVGLTYAEMQVVRI